MNELAITPGFARDTNEVNKVIVLNELVTIYCNI